VAGTPVSTQRGEERVARGAAPVTREEMRGNIGGGRRPSRRIGGWPCGGNQQCERLHSINLQITRIRNTAPAIQADGEHGQLSARPRIRPKKAVGSRHGTVAVVAGGSAALLLNARLGGVRFACGGRARFIHGDGSRPLVAPASAREPASRTPPRLSRWSAVVDSGLGRSHHEREDGALVDVRGGAMDEA
jgi:hypothetical protein